jgi:outer membrane lipoprotein carrier protein
MRPGALLLFLALLAFALSEGAVSRTARAADSSNAPRSTAAGQTGLLEHYLSDLTTLRTDFTQVVTDAQGMPVSSGKGSLLLQRPGKFRWDYRPDAAQGQDQGQLLVSDGRNVWFYDRELAQVTVKPIDAALTATPIMLLTGNSAQLQDHFDVSAPEQHEGLQWVGVEPRSAQADFSEAQIGFRGDSLVRMTFHDRLGQTVRLDFSHEQRNRPLDPAALEFKVPPGVDLIGKPVR